MNRDNSIKELAHWRSDLELFITAARLGNLGQAASLHHLSQSAASAAIMRVEKSLGRNLCITHYKVAIRVKGKGEAIMSSTGFVSQSPLEELAIRTQIEELG